MNEDVVANIVRLVPLPFNHRIHRDLVAVLIIKGVGCYFQSVHFLGVVLCLLVEGVVVDILNRLGRNLSVGTTTSEGHHLVVKIEDVVLKVKDPSVLIRMR